MASVIKHVMVWGPQRKHLSGFWMCSTISWNNLEERTQPALQSSVDLQGPIRITRGDTWLWQCKQFSIAHWSRAMTVWSSYCSWFLWRYSSSNPLIHSWNCSLSREWPKRLIALLPAGTALSPCSCRFSTKRGLITNAVPCTCSLLWRSALWARSQRWPGLKREATSL